MSKTVLITGASRGIGRETAKKFAQNGFRVVINYHNSEELAKNLERELLQNGCDCMAVCADVSDEKSVQTMFEKIAKFTNNIDVLVNNAGIDLRKLFSDTTFSEWSSIFNINVHGIFNCCKAVVPSMIQRKCGKIVNISSILGVRGVSMEVAYSASKAAVIGFTTALAKELGPCGVTVNCVAPGVIKTDMTAQFSSSDILALENATALGRLGTPADIANLVFFLASPESDFITGQVITADGGFL